jgi:hypothetical protein
MIDGWIRMMSYEVCSFTGKKIDHEVVEKKGYDI